MWAQTFFSVWSTLDTNKSSDSVIYSSTLIAWLIERQKLTNFWNWQTSEIKMCIQLSNENVCFFVTNRFTTANKNCFFINGSILFLEIDWICSNNFHRSSGWSARNLRYFCSYNFQFRKTSNIFYNCRILFHVYTVSTYNSTFLVCPLSRIPYTIKYLLLLHPRL